MRFTDFEPPLVAILRGLVPEDAIWTAEVLYDAGFRLLEVPLNRPRAVEAIRLLAAMGRSDVLIGGGTMLTVADVDAVFAAGGRLMVAPNANPGVIQHAVRLGMIAIPGVATPSEAFLALDAGAHVLKLFPAETIGHPGLVALRATLPLDTLLLPVGGITAGTLGSWKNAGANGAGIGSALYWPGISRQELGRNAREFTAMWAAA